MLKRRDYETRIIGSPSAVPIRQIVWYILAQKKKKSQIHPTTWMGYIYIFKATMATFHISSQKQSYSCLKHIHENPTIHLPFHQGEKKYYHITKS